MDLSKHPALRCVGLHKSFEGPQGKAVVAVDGVDLILEEGVILSLIGPSGCGKTTLLRLIAGFETPDRGSIEIGGVTVAGRNWLPPERRSVGMVFQEYALFPHLTVGENVSFGLERSSQKGGRVAELLALVGLVGLADRRPDQLSGGQQQRVAVARALARRPNVLLLDEPFSNIHADLRAQIRRELREILLLANTSAIFVTHDQEEALFMGHLVAVQGGGRIEQVATPEEIYLKPQTRAVAGFVGAVEYLEAQPIGQRSLETELGELLATEELPGGWILDVLVRPEDVLMIPDPHGQAAIERREFRGHGWSYAIRLKSGRTVRALTHHGVRLDAGQLVRVSLRPGIEYVVFAENDAVGLAIPTPGQLQRDTVST